MRGKLKSSFFYNLAHSCAIFTQGCLDQGRGVKRKQGYFSGLVKPGSFESSQGNSSFHLKDSDESEFYFCEATWFVKEFSFLPKVMSCQKIHEGILWLHRWLYCEKNCLG